LLSRRNNILTPSEIEARRATIKPPEPEQPFSRYNLRQPKVLPPDVRSRHDRVCELWLSGKKVREIEAETSIPKSTVTWIINKNGLWGKGAQSKRFVIRENS
jgi:DNA invertase Pin-like site-specific DNA recombinase